MNEELKRWYEAQFDLFGEQGYKDLMTTVNDMRENYQNLRNLPSEDTLRYRQGQLDILDWLAGWQNSVESNYKELQNENVV